jgi:hypothetical protein
MFFQYYVFKVFILKKSNTKVLSLFIVYINVKSTDFVLFGKKLYPKNLLPLPIHHMKENAR